MRRATAEGEAYTRFPLVTHRPLPHNVAPPRGKRNRGAPPATVTSAPPPLLPPPADANIGPFPATAFRLTTGRCADCPTIRQALWYFTGEIIAAPLSGQPVAGFTAACGAMDDVRAWAKTHPLDGEADLPPLVWVGSEQTIDGATIESSGAMRLADGSGLAFAPTAKIESNRSYCNARSIAFLSNRTLRMRGRREGDAFIARTIWPADFRLDSAATRRELQPTPEALRQLVREEARGGAQSPFASAVLWERTPGAAEVTAGTPVLAVMLNGAQGDDDEAHGGHFALVTGNTRNDGAIADWLVNNFYTLDAISEKGILASAVPLDNYLADLNSGQAWYRPSYLLVATLRSPRTAARVQSALGRVFNQFYRHQLKYHHATMNCTGISVDTLRALGWSVPARGPTSRVLAALGLPLFALKDRSIEKARLTYDYLTEDCTRLLPAVAFEDMGSDLLRIVQGRSERPTTAFEQALAEDVDSIQFLRIPQIPSSRAWGNAPAASAREYLAAVPSDPALVQIIPVPLLPFPPELRDPDLLPTPWRRSTYALGGWVVALLLAAVGILFALR